MRFSWKVPREYIRMTEEQHPAASSSGHIQELDLVENLTSKKEYVKHQIDLPGGSTVYVWKTSTEHVVLSKSVDTRDVFSPLTAGFI